MRDTDGDLRMDTKTRVTDQFGRRDIDVENNANGFDWGLDNRMRTAGQSRLHFQWKAGTILAAPVAHARPVGHDARRCRTDVPEHERVGAARRSGGRRVLRAPSAVAAHARQLRAAGDARQRPERGVAGAADARASTAAIRPACGAPTARWPATPSVCTPLVYRGDRLPADAYGNVFVAEPAANLVSRITLRDDGATLRAAKAWPDAEFLASTDERFRPVYLSNAPDGTLYLVDLYRGVVEHRLSLTSYLKSYIEARGLLQPRGLGRIWRIVHDGTRARHEPVARRGTPQDLVALLSHPNGWRRDTAQRLLVERGDASVAPALVRLARDAADERDAPARALDAGRARRHHGRARRGGAGGSIAARAGGGRAHRGTMARRAHAGVARGDRGARRGRGPARAPAGGRLARRAARRRAQVGRAGAAARRGRATTRS